VTDTLDYYLKKHKMTEKNKFKRWSRKSFGWGKKCSETQETLHCYSSHKNKQLSAASCTLLQTFKAMPDPGNPC